MTFRSIFKTFFLFAAGAAIIASCDSEYNDIGADIIAGDIHHNGMQRYEGSVVAYDQATGAVQGNNLPFTTLGIYNNPAFGKTTAQFVTQLELASLAPKISAEAAIDSVYLYVPYYSRFKSIDANTGASLYELDSIYGNVTSAMTLRVYRNGYFLRSTDPGSAGSEAQKYYSDDLYVANGVDAEKEDLLAETTSFTFSNAEVQRRATVNGTQKVVERFSPGIYMPLNNAYFRSAILTTPAANLENDNVFKNYFRGLYFNITANSSQGAMAATRFAEGRIVIIYKDRPYKLDGSGFDTSAAMVRKTITLNMKGNTVNFFQNEYSTGFQNALTQTNVAQGDSRLYIKGGAGSVGVLKILSAQDVAALRGDDVLINEANLIFYVDRTAMTGTPNPGRVYLYDLKNNRPLFDYYGDATVVKSIYGGIRASGTLNGAERVRYKIRLTNHISNILKKDSTNVPLGLVLTDNINTIANVAIKTPFSTGLTAPVKIVPLTSVINPLGTVLYGNNIQATDPDTEAESQKLKLEIFYTKPN